MGRAQPPAVQAVGRDACEQAEEGVWRSRANVTIPAFAGECVSASTSSGYAIAVNFVPNDENSCPDTSTRSPGSAGLLVLGGTMLVLALATSTTVAAQPAVSCPLPSADPNQPPQEFPATIVGTEGNDFIRGTEGQDVIAGLGGNDRIFGFGGDDLICGGLGNDVIDGGDGSDFILGDTGDTFRRGFPGGMNVPGGNDVIYGGDGDDGLAGEGGNDVLRGGDGDDFATGQMGIDGVFGDAGDDDLFGGPAEDFVYGGDGDDFLVGNFGGDVLLGGSGDDELFGDAFFDDPGAFDICIGQQGFDRSAACEINSQNEGDLEL